MKLVDTSVVVDIDRGGVDERVSRLDDEGRHALSAVRLTGLRLGLNRRYGRDTDRFEGAAEALDRLVARFNVLPVDRSVAMAAADIIDELVTGGRRLVDLHDVYISATARTEQIPVLTANVPDFDRINVISVVDWESY